MPRRVRSVFLLALLAAPLVATATPAAADAPLEQTITVERPAGQLVIGDFHVADGRLSMTVTDTRADDPGWAVHLGSPASAQANAPFQDASGTRYEQLVTVGSDGTVSAAPNHGLGIAQVSTVTVTDGRVTITVI